jgi:HEAT repeat protein
MPLIRRPPEPTPEVAPRLDIAISLANLSPDERWAAARSADRPADVPALARALGVENDRRVREALFTALARISTPECAAVAAQLIRSEDANVRAGALDALRAMPSITKPLVPSLLADPDPDVRLLACDLARDAGGADGPAWLCELLESEPQANVCAAAVETLAEIGDSTATPHLRRCAARFTDNAFLSFAIRETIDRLRAEGKGPDG